MDMSTTKHETKRTPVRTCAGCGKRCPAEDLVRVVLDPTVDPATIVVDLSDSAFGRGAHVHPSQDCLVKAVKSGFSKAFKTKVVVKGDELAAQLILGGDRRIEGLLMGARRAKHLVMGADSCVEALRADKVALLIVATDAAAAAQLGEVRDAIAAGKAIAWSTKGRLGALLGRDEVAVCGVTQDTLSKAISAAYRVSRSTVWSSSEVR